MHLFKSLPLLTLLVAPLSLSAQMNRVETVLTNQSTVQINGTSNVNSFSCAYGTSFAQDTLSHEVSIQEDSVVAVSGDDLALKVDAFDCGKKAINKDFRNTLKSEKHPTIDVSLSRLIHEQGVARKAEIIITIAEVSQSYIVRISQERTEEDGHIISGSQMVKLTDFNLEPPRAMFGLIKVRDELEVEFSLTINQ